MRKITFITGNENKLAEAQVILSDYEVIGKSLDVPEIQSLDPREVVEHKLLLSHEALGEVCFVEDISFTCGALGALPGPFIKWFEQSLGNQRLANIILRHDNHRARALCTIGYVDHSGSMHFFEGVNEGVVVAARGESSFGFDPIFLPDGYDQTYGEMSLEQKSSMSHRYQALKVFDEFLGI